MSLERVLVELPFFYDFDKIALDIFHHLGMIAAFFFGCCPPQHGRQQNNSFATSDIMSKFKLLSASLLFVLCAACVPNQNNNR